MTPEAIVLTPDSTVADAIASYETLISLLQYQFAYL